MATPVQAASQARQPASGAGGAPRRQQTQVAPAFPESASLFEAASQPDMVRSAQKDAYYIAQLQDDINEFSAAALGAGSTRWQSEAALAAELLYYALTSGAGGRTLGEEYCDLEPVSATGRPATRVRRAAFVALHVLVPYLFRRLRKHGRRVAVDADANIVTRSSAWLWNHIVSLALRSDAALVVAQRWHLAFFYLFGAYLHFARRGAGLRYLYVRRLDQPRVGYTLLGVLMIVQLSTLAALACKDAAVRWWRRRTREPSARGHRLGGRRRSARARADDDEVEDEDGHRRGGDESDGDDDDGDNDGGDDDAANSSDADEEAGGAPACPLCLSARRRPTATECGHVFCWACIAECVHKKPECPLCRAAVQMNQLLLLTQYK